MKRKTKLLIVASSVIFITLIAYAAFDHWRNGILEAAFLHELTARATWYARFDTHVVAFQSFGGRYRNPPSSLVSELQKTDPKVVSCSEADLPLKPDLITFRAWNKDGKKVVISMRLFEVVSYSEVKVRGQWDSGPTAGGLYEYTVMKKNGKWIVTEERAIGAA